MIRKICYLLILIATNATAQTADTMNVKLKSGVVNQYALTSVNSLTFSGVQGMDTLNLNLKSGSLIQYSISSLDGINFSNDQSADSIFIKLNGNVLQKYAISSISAMSFIGWDESTSIETVKLETENGNNLGQNYPNPFNLSTTIPYYLTKRQHVTLTVSSMTGRAIVTLVKEQQSSGMHQISWDTSTLPGGVYFYRLQVGEYMETKKMILLK
ncbi:MAG: T9SS type A sorting domain-containing protein, partial [Saprospiraceae bacterium]